MWKESDSELLQPSKAYCAFQAHHHVRSWNFHRSVVVYANISFLSTLAYCICIEYTRSVSQLLMDEVAWGWHRNLLKKANHESVNVCMIVCVNTCTMWRRFASIFISLIHSDNMLFFSHFSYTICFFWGADVIWYDSTRFDVFLLLCMNDVTHFISIWFVFYREFLWKVEQQTI